MHDATMLDTTHSTLRALTSKLLGGYMGEEMTGVLTARHSGVWLWFPSNGKKILTCRGTLTGDTHQLCCIHLILFPLSVSECCCLADLPCISRSSAVRPTLQTLAPIQSSTSFCQDLFGLPLFLRPFTFPSSIKFSSVWCVVICLK